MRDAPERFDADSNKRFSSASRLRALGVFCKDRTCTVKDISRGTGVSKVTAARMIRSLSEEGLIKKKYYRPVSGRGVKPERYALSDKVSCLLIDKRTESAGIFFYSLPSLERTGVVPKIRSDRPAHDKRSVLS